ncbi:MAG: rhodanese-like domain-containing protein [Pusillimonas sp.]
MVSEVSVASIDPGTLRSWLADGQELALLDVREELTFSKGHLLMAACIPLSRLEVLVPDRVPRRGTRICCCDDGSGLALAAARALRRLGYDDLAVLDGGLPAWQAAGHTVYTGVHVPSKAFAEVLEHENDTPTMDVEEFARRREAGENMLNIDVRTFDEYQVDSIPGSISAPGGEILLRIQELAADPDVTVVVNCGGRTRSIIGAQSLINAAIPSKVVSLRNGTMAWHLAGHALESRQGLICPEPSRQSLELASTWASNLIAKFNIARINQDTYRRWQAESNSRSLYVLDVRSPREYLLGHLPEAISAPGGQLVQETDGYVATLGSRIVLVDSASQVRAALAASWLLQMGWDDVVILEDGLEGAILEVGPRQPRALGLPSGGDLIAPTQLQSMLDGEEPVVIDVSLSSSYKAGHIPGSCFVVRARLEKALAGVAPGRPLVFVSEDGVLARYAAFDAAGLGRDKVSVLDGGMKAWAAEGLPVESGFTAMMDIADDVWYVPRDQEHDREKAMQEYIDWELGLVAQVSADPDCRFACYRSAR